MRTPEIVLVTRRECHLCEAAREVVARVAADAGLPWSERLMDDDAELAERFAEEVPVVLVDGVQRDFWRIDEARLRRTIAAAVAQSASSD
ncbi:glutaredoxin family protein [Sinomonas sp. JGH33]|uniref:Glutaredoxin family protein n=1 Tax=Sinomonas terricola TaxID=3110330 RepID=A0ABU5T256_9MICC|nr:glutaredoxin family protein [Sinomonas sp. JGH33]MEA5453742.1 glutaredoxin family protein [Sinomonas sp. JGH33]